MDVEQLIGLLRKAVSDEWLAYYQYGVGAQGVEGPMKDAGITSDAGLATVRVIRADEERMIARSVCRVLGFGVDG